MGVALIVLLVVDVVLIAAFAGLVIARRRWLARRPGGFAGAIRVASGTREGFPGTWRRGSGRWVRDVVVWSRSPLLLSTGLLPIDALTGRRTAGPDEVPGFGERPVVVRFTSGGAVVEVVVRPEHLSRCLGPFSQPDF